MKLSRIQIITNSLVLIPGVFLLFQFLAESLSANPIQAATVITGRAAIYLLLISLFCSPLQRFLKMSVFHPIRKTTGLYSFYYSIAHFIIFSVFDYQLNFNWIIPEFRQKTFLQIGLIALLLLSALAITSLKTVRRRLGGWWKRLHSLVYIIAGIILIHINLASKGDIFGPLLLSGIYALAMILRMPPFRNISIKSLPVWAKKANDYLMQ